MIKIFPLLFFIFVIPAFADDLVCDSGIGEIYAFFSPKTFNCSNSQFLPANSESCANCPNGYSCTGGELTFNEHKSSGMDLTQKITNAANNVCSANFPSELYATWTPKTITCDAGKYLPENSEVCISCSMGNKCPGGTYSFNETNDQGIEPCTSSTPHAPAGSSACYPHIMHLSNERPNDVIYLKSTATTSPALNIDMNNDGIADVFANMTTTQTPMTSISEHYLKIMVNGVLYYVCDDSSCQQ